MKKKYTFVVIAFLLSVSACKKDNAAKPRAVYKSDLVAISANTQLYSAAIDATAKTVDITIPYTTDKKKLTLQFILSDQAFATINNVPVTSGGIINATDPLAFKITSKDKKTSVTWALTVKTDLEEYGLGSNVTGDKSLSRAYDYYFDQFDGSTYQSINCGPTVTTMAIKWADATYAQKPADARNEIRPMGGWWYTSDIDQFLSKNGISHTYIDLPNTEGVVKSMIDKNYLLILCLDMFYVDLNTLSIQHTNKFYNTTAPDWGHFLLVKGYKQVDSKFYLEINDPYSDDKYYPAPLNNQLKGKSRYYLSTAIKKGTDVWWRYAIVVAEKGKTVVLPLGTKKINNVSAIPRAMGR